MIPEHLVELLALAENKRLIDQDSGWASGAETYLDGLRDEVTEVKDELYSGRVCYLEDELGDLLWNYLNALQLLDHQQKISIENVFERARDKYQQRIEGIQQGERWADIKADQKQQLAQEHWAMLSKAVVNEN